jgi:hypothetical protein
MSKTQAQKVPVTMRALLQRINRKLAKNEKSSGTRGGGRGSKLLACRETSPAFRELGAYYSIDVGRNHISERHVDPEKLGRELGVLQPWEKVAEEET